jgi:hypothetical protein
LSFDHDPLPLPASMNSIASVAASDPAATRLVYALVAALVLLGLAMIALTVWLVRSTRPERELLAPLELMSHRKWRGSDPVWQRRQLDAVRPPGAEPLAAAPPVPTPDIDLRSIERNAPRDFDDLASDLLAGLPAADSSVLVTDLDATTPAVGDQNEGGSVLVTDLGATTPAVGDQNEGGSVLVTDLGATTPEVRDQNEGVDDPDSTPTRMVDPLLELFRKPSAE